MRPKNYYVHLTLGTSPKVVLGSILARKVGAQQRPFKTEQAAQEWAAWWEHDFRPLNSAAPRDEIPTRPATTATT